MAAAGIRRLVHVSALQAGAAAPSGYLRSKHAGEAVLRAAPVDLTILRPSVIFGAGDSFLTLFARLLRPLPVLPLACPEARFQPVWVGDVAAVCAEALARSASIGESYDLCGPRRYSLRELVAWVARLQRRRRLILPLGERLSWLQAAVMECVPGSPLCLDNFYSMQAASVCADGCALPFGRRAHALEEIVPAYLAA